MTFKIQSKTQYTRWRTEEGCEYFDTMIEAEATVENLKKQDVKNDECYECVRSYRVVENECSS